MKIDVGLLGTVNMVSGLLASIASFAVVGSMVLQALKNRKNRSTEGFSSAIAFVASVTYTLWGVYAWTKPTPDHYLGYSQVAGALVAYFLVYQVVRYRKRD